jgi:hypothetical protein
METSGIKLEEKRKVTEKHETEVKHEPKSVLVKEDTN